MSDPEERIWAITLELAQHHRLDPMGRNDRCSCGFRTQLGRMYSEHIARIVATL